MLALILLDVALVLRHQRLLRVQLLFRNGVGREQHLVALQIDLGVVEQSLVVRQRTLSQFQLNLIGPRVDLDEDLAFLDQIAFVEIHLHQLAVDARLDGDGIERGYVAEPVQIDRNTGASNLG